MKKLLLVFVFSLVCFFSCSSDNYYSISEQEYGGVLEGYRTYAEANVFIDDMVFKYPTITKKDSIGKSTLGREIPVLIISKNPNVIEDEPRVRLTGAIHGNEFISGEVLFRFIEYLLSHYDDSPEITELINSRYIAIIPIFNVDGHERGSRYNANRVDLNRNFPFYDFSVERGGYFGSAAFDQRESQAMRDFSKKLFHLSMTFHAGEVVINLPFDYTHEYPSENNLLWHLGSLYATAGFSDNPGIYKRSPAVNGVINGWDWYRADGSLQDWSYIDTGCIDITVEVARISPRNDADINTVFEYNRDSLLAYIEAAGHGICGVVKDSSGHGIEGVAVKRITTESPQETDLVVYTDANGYYMRVCDAGTYKLSFSKEGYTEIKDNITVPVNGYTTIDVSW